MPNPPPSPGLPAPPADVFQPEWVEGDEGRSVGTLLFVVDFLQQFGRALDIRAGAVVSLKDAAAELAPGKRERAFRRGRSGVRWVHHVRCPVLGLASA